MSYKKGLFIISFLALGLLPLHLARAMPLGTLLYRSSDNGRMYGYSSDQLVRIKNGVLSGIDCGHVALYVGSENGEHYVVEALADGLRKMPLKYFINLNNGEEFVGAKIPKEASFKEREKAVLLAKKLAEKDLGYDFDFRKQKGPGDGEWTCVGFTEKVYESAGADSFFGLEYNTSNYAVNITPEGYNEESIINPETGDCFSSSVEFSRISSKKRMLVPAPEIFGFDAGLEYNGDRYFFLPYTQFLQDSLVDVELDVELASAFPDQEIRGKVPKLGLLLRWTLINNPKSSLKNIARSIMGGYKKIKSGQTEMLNDNKGYNDQLVVREEESDLAFSSQKDKDVNYKVIQSVAPPKTTKTKITGETKLKSESEKKKADEPVIIAKKIEPELETANPEAKIIKGEEPVEISQPVNFVKIVQPVEPAPVIVNNENDDNSAGSQETDGVDSYDNISNQYEDTNNTQSSSSSGASSTGSGSVDYSYYQEEPAEDIDITLLISRIYAEGDDDWIELYNYGDVDLDLAELGIRLEKTKTALDPNILLRFDFPEDANYNTTVIPAKGYYFIVRDDANEDLKNLAQAVALRDEFTWTADGYGIYLSSDAVSTNSDDDIIDYIGFGTEALYYEGLAPASAIYDCHLLERKATATSTLELMEVDGSHEFLGNGYDSNNNEFDFVLMPICSVGEETDDSDDGNDDDEGASDSQIQTVDQNNIRLIHFDECQGTVSADTMGHSYDFVGNWAVGQQGCAWSQSHDSEAYVIDLSNLDNQFSFSWLYKLSDNARYHLEIADPSIDSLRLTISDIYTEIKKPEGENVRHDIEHSPNQWHRLLLSINDLDDELIIYEDGEEIWREAWDLNAFSPQDLKLQGENFISTVDELSVWQGILDQSDFSDLDSLVADFSIANVSLSHHWGFDLATSTLAIDSVGTDNIFIQDGLRMHSGYVDQGIIHTWRQQPIITLDLDQSISGPGMALGWWWKNIDYPNEARGEVRLLDNGRQRLMALTLSQLKPSYHFNNVQYYFDAGFMPQDNQWHYYKLSYDPESFVLALSVDNSQVESGEVIWPQFSASSLEIESYNFDYYLDELSIWE